MRRFDRPAVGLHLAHVAAADEAERPWSKLSPLNSSMHMPIAPEAMNGLKLNLSLSKKPIDVRDGLMGEVAPDHAGVGDGIVGRADARQQQQLHVEDCEGAEHHEIRRLLPFLAAGVDEGDAGRALAGRVEVDAHHLANSFARSKFDLRTSTGRSVVCGLALE